jgi:aspartate kinase
MEQNLVVRGVAFEDDITRVTILGLPNSLTGLSTIFSALANNHINVDIIIQSMTEAQTTNLSFSIKNEDLTDTVKVLEKNRDSLNYDRIEWESGLAKVSIVGSGMISNPGVAAEMFEVLSANEIQVKMVSTSEIKVSAVVENSKMLEAVDALHDAFRLSDSAVKA